MSTFTDFNGPQPSCMPTTKSILELVHAYQEVLSTLDKHIHDNVNATTGEENNQWVHGIKTYVDNKLADLDVGEQSTQIADIRKAVMSTSSTDISVDFVNTYAAMFVDAADADVKNAKSVIQSLHAIYVIVAELKSTSDLATITQKVEQLDKLINGYDITNQVGATVHVPGALENISALATKLDALYDDSGESPTGIVADLQQAITRHSFENVDVSGTATVHKAVVKEVHTTFGAVTASSYMGQADGKHWYALGQLKDKVGSLFVKFVDSNNMSANISWALSKDDTPEATGETTGIITVDVTRALGTWTGLSFAICKATAEIGNQMVQAYYLCLAKNDLSGAVAAFTPKVAGINIATVEDDDYNQFNSDGSAIVIARVDVTDYIGSTHVSGGTGSSSTATDGVPIGVGLRWPFGSDRVPAKYVFAGGQTVNKSDYTQLAEAWGIQTDTFVIPAEDYTIYKCEA